MTTHLTGIHTTAIPVTDQDRAIAYYVDVLGMELRMDASLDDQIRWVEVAPPGSQTTVSLISEGDDFRAGRDTGVRLTTRSAAEDHSSLTERGVDTDELLTWPGVPPMFAMRDLDGNTLYVMEFAG